MAAVLLLAAAMLAQKAPSTSKSPDLDIPAIARETSGSVVSIVMSDKDGHPLAQGSGFLISKDGHVVTNYHVIKSGISAVVKLPNGTFFAVDGVLASDKVRDVAIIKAHGVDFHTLTLGDSDRLRVGEEVVAIGNPLSLESTVSNGIVSGIRIVEAEAGKYLQITAPISPGSSGGPLFNMEGEVVGITTSHLVGGENLNFAIPINDVKPLLMASLSRTRSLPNEPEPISAEPATGDPRLFVTPLFYIPGEVSIEGDFRTAFAADPVCSGITLIRDGSKGNPVGWSDENNYWWVTGHEGEGFFNWNLYRRSQNFSADGKTPMEAAHNICTIVKRQGGQIQ
jgi:S1-C subfamily serine protease